MDVQNIIVKLSPVFEKHNVVFAYLFGSMAKNETSATSDIDIAIYLKNVTNEKFFDTLLSIHYDTCKALVTDKADIIILHYLYLLSDSCITLAELVIKYKKLRIPQAYHEAIDILGENNILDADFAYSFAKIDSFRNYLAHDFEHISPIIISNEILNKLNDVEKYLPRIEKSLGINFYK